MSTIEQLVLSRTRDVADFPQPGVVFKDLTPLFGDAAAFGEVTEAIAQRWRGRVEAVAGVEARGFIVGPPVALALGVPFVPVRKAGKLPGDVVSQTYDLEYGTATIEIQRDAPVDGRRVLLMDDVLATGGTAVAAARLLTQCGARVTGMAFLVELGFLDGRTRLPYDIQTLAAV